MNRNETLRNLLIAAGAAIEAALSFCEEDGEEQTKPCLHQEERRKNLSTMGWQRWQCLDCGHVHEAKVGPGEEVDS